MSVTKVFGVKDYAAGSIINVTVENLSSAPGSPVKGRMYFDSTLNQFGVYNGSAWVYLTTAGSANVSKATNASAANVMQVSGGADKTLADFISAGGIVKVSSTGVVSIAVLGTDYITAGSTNALTNKTFDAAGTGNTLSNIAVSMFAVNVADTDTTLAANSDTRFATQKAVKAYIDGKVTGLATAKGGIDCSTNPNYPAATIGDYYRVTVAGLIGGGSGVAVQVGDVLECFVTTVAGNQATVGSSWTIVQANTDQATTSTLGLVQLATNGEALAKSNTTKAVTPAALVGFTQKITATIGDGASTSLIVTDNLGTNDKIGVLRDAGTNAQVECDIVYGTNTTTYSFVTAPASNSYKAVIIG